MDRSGYRNGAGGEGFYGQIWVWKWGGKRRFLWTDLGIEMTQGGSSWGGWGRFLWTDLGIEIGREGRFLW